jgi:hypothetical protein
MMTPVDTRAKLSTSDGTPIANPSKYRSLDGVRDAHSTRFGICNSQVCLFMLDPRERQLALIKRILRYVKGSTISTGLDIGTEPT